MTGHIFRILLITCVIATSLLLGGAARAQDEELPDPGITPDSPFYFLDNMSKGIGMFFAFGNEAKARKALQYAEERLAETQAMADKNRAREMGNAAEEYEDYMAQLLVRVQQAPTDNVSETVAQATAKHLAVLERLREQASGQVALALERAISISENGQINALRALAKNKPERAIDIDITSVDRKLERLRARATDNVSSDNVTYAIVNSLGYAATLAELEDEIIAAAEAQGIDSTRLRQRLAQATTNRLEVLVSVHEIVPEQARPALENAIENSVRKYERAVETLKENGALDDIPEESPAMQMITEEVKNRLRITSAASGQPSGEKPEQTQTLEEVTERLREQPENNNPETSETETSENEASETEDSNGGPRIHPLSANASTWRDKP